MQGEGFFARVVLPLLLPAFVHSRSPMVQAAGYVEVVELVLMTKSEDSFPKQALSQQMEEHPMQEWWCWRVVLPKE